MDNITISHILKKIIKKKDNYLGIFTPPQLNHISIDKYKCLILILFIPNISKNYGHWTSIVKIRNKFYFLDSFGLKPKLYHIYFKNAFKTKKIYDFYYLNFQIQSKYATTCGAYVIFFIQTIILCKYSIPCFKKKIINHLKHKIKIKNDRFIIQYMYTHFKNNLSINCEKLFCNNKFIINRGRCVESLCK